MRYIILFFLTLNLYGAGFWTLTGLTKANVYVQNDIAYLKPETLTKIKTKVNATLKGAKIVTKQQDAPTLMVALQELSNEEAHYVYVKLAVGEEVQTFREDKSATFALTYDSSDFIETDDEDLDNDVLESVDFLLSQFLEQYEDDKE
jgi:hypothetical protein